MPEAPLEPRYRRLAEDLASATSDLRDVLEAGTSGDLNPFWTSAYLGMCERLRNAADVAEGIILRDLERAGRRRALTWREIGEARRTTTQAAHSRGQRLMGPITVELNRMRTAAEQGEHVALTDVEAAALWPADELPPPTVDIIPTTRTTKGEAVVDPAYRPRHWPNRRSNGA